MKKLFTILALALAMVACQKDGDVNVTNGDLATVTLNLNAPALDVTRADENGEDDSVNGKESAYGAIDYADAAFWAKYDLRYILEVYDENDNGTGTNIAAARQYKYVDEYEQTTFEVKLVPNRKYKFVVWADFVKEDNRTDDLYYNTTDLRQISIITTAEGFNAMNEARDAYFITQNLEIKKDVDQTLVLKRPLAKLRVVTKDKQHWAKYSTPAQVVVKYYDSALSNVFNAVNGNIDATNSPLQQLTYDVTYATAASQYNETTDNKTLFADYLFAIPGAHIPVHFTMDVLESDGRLIRSNDFNTEIPIERNHLTTIYGDILTTATDIKVGINDNFDKEKPIDYDEDEWSNDNANQTTTLTPEGTVNGKTDVAYDNNGGYTITSAEGIDVTIAASTLKNGQLAAGVYNYGTDFTVADFQYTIPAAGTAAVKLEANTVTAKVTGGTMEVLVSTDGTQTINLDLDIEYAATEGAKPEQAKVEYTMESTFVFEEIELEALVTPVVEAAVDGNVVTLTWTAIENAGSYSITVGTEMPVFVEGTTYAFTGEYATTYTFNVVAVPADEEKYLPSAACEVEATTAEKPAEAEAYKLYFENVAEWAKVYAYIWANEGETLGIEYVEWPGRELTETEELNGKTYYVFQLPAEATGKTLNVVFNDGAGTQTGDLGGVVVGNLFCNNYVEPVEPSDVVLYLQPNANWNVDGARFAAYFFGNGETWVDMTLVEGETNIYAVTVPAGFENVIFCRMNPSTPENNWNDDTRWNQTSDLVIPTDGTNLYTVAEGAWSKGDGAWSTYTTALATPVVEAAVEGNVVTLTWEAVANAASYSITVGTEMPVFVEETTYVFTGEYETEYTFNVVAVPADEEKFTASEAGVATATTEAAPVVEPEVLAELDANAYYIFKQATEMKGGKWYAIVYENKAATGLTANYGYLKVTEAASRANGISLPATCAYGFLTTDGGYTIQQFDNKYVYQTGSYDSFNVNATLPTDGGVWSVAVNGNEYTITNNTMSKFVQYDSAYGSYGCYASSKGSLPTLYELVEVDNTPMILDLSTSKLSFSSAAESKTITVTTYGVATLTVNENADWVSTSIADNVVTVTVEANAGEGREATLTISYGEDSKEVTIAQAEYVEEGTTVTYTDTLTSDMFTATSTTYTEFSNVAGNNGAVYAGKSSKSQNGGYIQLRSSKSEDGIVTTASGGKVKKVVVEWDDANTTDGRTLDVYVSNTAYTSATELYGTVVGEKVGGIVKGTSTELVIDGDYNYVGLRSNNGAMYIKSITITYEK
ncbi:MAG: starch-binding protein [Alistipes sp.]|nr:starch-binding protein [Alistipes sp.]